MFQYYMHIQWDNTKNVYTATFPDILGVNGHGNTYDEAARHCREILDKLIALAKERDEQPVLRQRKGPFEWIGREARACDELIGKGYYKFASDWHEEHNGNEDGMLDTWLLSNGQKAAFSEEVNTEKEVTPLAGVAMPKDQQKKIFAVLEELIDIEEEDGKRFDALEERFNGLDKRLKKLERYAQE
jgi:predicted RNase H-like HicB family nuclease